MTPADHQAPPTSRSLGTKILKGLRRPWAIVEHVRFLNDPQGTHRVVRLPAAPGPRRGTVVLSYLTDCFAGDPAAHYHTNRWECRCMARVLTDAGYHIDAIHTANLRYRPPADCAAVIDLHSNLERLAALVPSRARKILHATGAHWEFQNRAEQSRLAALRARRGVTLPPRRQVPPSRGIEVADLATTTGNAFTIGTFAFAGKPMYRVPLSSTYTQDWPAAKDFAFAAKRFLWLGSHGLVHKGLDLVLEAFAQAPDLQLTVAGPVGSEPDFAEAYRRELAAPNVRVLDWVDTTSAVFRDLLATHAAVVYPSCSEGGGGSVVTCLHGGLVPIVTREASVDTGDFGFELPTAGVAELVAALRQCAALAPDELAERSRAAWELARRQHTRENFERVFRQLVRDEFHLPDLSGPTRV
jgi:glycosyltransferase involved in cell wall biosynthesis